VRRVRALLLRIGGLFGRARRERELAEELDAHVSLHIEENLRTGMSAEEARRAALVRLGGIEQTKEAYRERRGLPFLETLWQDLRFAARMLRKNPGFTTVAVLTLALGIGANTAIFSIVHSTLLRPLPYKDSGRLVTFVTKSAMFPQFSLGLSWPAFEELRTHAGSLEKTAATWSGERTLTRTGAPVVLNVTQVSDGFFDVFGTHAERGRLLTDQDHKPFPNRIAVISYNLWRTRFGADPALVGRSLILDDQTYTVVGVADKDFAFPEKTDVWLPLSLTPENERSNTLFRLGVFGKLREGETLQSLKAEVTSIASRLAQQMVKEQPNLRGGYQIVSQTLLNSFVEDSRTGYLVLLAAATLVLMIACANLTSLLLVRGWGRHPEMAVRAALGASASRLRRQCLVESCLLALLGGAVGIALSAGGVEVFRAIAPPETARLSEVSVDSTLLLFALASSLVSGMVFGLAPAQRAARMAPNEALKQAGSRSVSGRTPLGNALVVAEVALAFVLLIASTLMVRTLGNLLHQNPGFQMDHLLTLELPQIADAEKVRLPDDRLTTGTLRLRELLAEIGRLPGVEGVAASDHSVLGGLAFSNAGLRLEGALPGNASIGEGVIERSLSPGYFQLLKIPLLRGRDFNDHDMRGSQSVAIINETMARKYWGTLDVVGKRMRSSKDAKANSEWMGIIGVVADTRDIMIQNEPEAEFFVPLFQQGADSHFLLVRTQTNPDALANTICRQIWSANPDQPVMHVSTMTATIAQSVGDQRMHTMLLGIFAAIGLTLAPLGVYGVVSYSVARRTQEIGVRVALGAGRADVLRMVLRQGLTLVAIGAVIGVAGAIGAVRAIASELYGVTPTDPWTYAGSVGLILVVGCLACWIPARRAMSVDPMIALRHD
jgi:predicted permease